MDNENNSQVINPGDSPSQPEQEQPTASPQQSEPSSPPEQKKRRKLKPKLILGIAGGFLVLIVLLLAIPASRYTMLGLFIKKDYQLSVVDSQTGTPVSSAQVVLGGREKQTDADGVVKFQEVNLGKQTIKISKKYYKNYSGKVNVAAFSDGQKSKVDFVASGRTVEISINNKIDGKPLRDVNVRAAGTEVKTNNEGQATIVLPADSEMEEATFQLEGYNGLVDEIIIIEPDPNQNQFSMTPSGRLYFLSKLSGNIDLVKTNLDGSDRQVVLAGTGNEQEASTTLSISRDWRYLALKARREASQPKLYLIDTEAEEKLTIMEQGDAEFLPIGWSGHKFVYRVEKNVAPWQKGRHSLRYYDAKADKIVKVDESAAGGTDNYFSYFETIDNIFALSDKILYSKTWVSSSPSSITDETTRILEADYEGAKPKAMKKFPAPQISFISAVHHKPERLYIAAGRINGNTDYFEYKDGKLQSSGIDTNTFQRPYPTYLVSPSGERTFWNENRDGQSVLFVGDEQASDENDFATLTDFKAFGWYGSDYVLASKSGHELYIMAPEEDLDPLKVDNFHKPPYEATGQSYSYGSQ